MVPVQPGCVQRVPERSGVVGAWTLSSGSAAGVVLSGPGLPHTSQ